MKLSVEILKQDICKWDRADYCRTDDTPWNLKRSLIYGERPVFLLDFPDTPRRGDTISVQMEENLTSPEHNMLPGITRLLVVNVEWRTYHHTMDCYRVIQTEIISPNVYQS